jgi:predicted nucleotidyltransferase
MTVEALQELTPGDLSGLPEIMRRHGVLLLVLFGSLAKRKGRTQSDLDLGVLLPGTTPEDDWLRQEADLQADLEALLQPDCPLHLIVLNRASETLRKEVADHGRVLYGDVPERWIDFRIRANRAFEDSEKYRRRRWEQLLRKYGVSSHAAHAGE